MNSNIAQIFGIPVVKVENAYSLNTEELNFIKNIPYDKDNNVSSDLFLLNKYTSQFKNLKDKINECANKFIKEIICVDNDFELTNSWIARTNKIHKKHNHRNTIFSVVYYVQADNATLKFYREKNFIDETLFSDLNYKSYNNYNSKDMEFEVRTGDIMIFPGYIEHEGINHSDKEKIILGANYFIRGDVGKYENVTSLKV